MEGPLGSAGDARLVIIITGTFWAWVALAVAASSTTEVVVAIAVPPACPEATVVEDATKNDPSSASVSFVCHRLATFWAFEDGKSGFAICPLLIVQSAAQSSPHPLSTLGR